MSLCPSALSRKGRLRNELKGAYPQDKQILVLRAGLMLRRTPRLLTTAVYGRAKRDDSEGKRPWTLSQRPRQG